MCEGPIELKFINTFADFLATLSHHHSMNNPAFLKDPPKLWPGSWQLAANRADQCYAHFIVLNCQLSSRMNSVILRWQMLQLWIGIFAKFQNCEPVFSQSFKTVNRDSHLPNLLQQNTDVYHLQSINYCYTSVFFLLLWIWDVSLMYFHE